MKRFDALLLFALAVVLLSMVAGCASVDGDGFSNSGRPHGNVCKSVDKHGHEIWRDCE